MIDLINLAEKLFYLLRENIGLKKKLIEIGVRGVSCRRKGKKLNEEEEEEN